MHSLKYCKKLRLFWSGCIGVLLVSSNWNNGTKAGVSYQNANNRSTNTNVNIGTRTELMSVLSGPEQQPNRNLIHQVKHTANPPGVLVLFGRFSRNGRAEP
jgi:hypothetical protein